MPPADWLILAALAIVIALAVRYARRHPKVPPEVLAAAAVSRDGVEDVPVLNPEPHAGRTLR